MEESKASMTVQKRVRYQSNNGCLIIVVVGILASIASLALAF